MISHLDYLMSLPQVHREIYGYEEENKPNDYCVWTDIGYSKSLMALGGETDEHFRDRIKEIKLDCKIET
jgi:hypothetical protein